MKDVRSNPGAGRIAPVSGPKRHGARERSSALGVIAAVGLAIAGILAGPSTTPASAAGLAGPDECMEVTRTVIGSYAALQLTGFFLRGGTGSIPTSPSDRCRGAFGDIDACFHAGRSYPPGAMVVRANPRGVEAAAICVRGIWE